MDRVSRVRANRQIHYLYMILALFSNCGIARRFYNMGFVVFIDLVVL
jgi:hypothetical protein